MIPVQHTIAKNEELLGVLAMQFRGTRNQAERKAIKKEYEQTVERLIKSGKWNDVPATEDQLPDDWMPHVFFEYWSLR
jgi:hypothetical protein